MSSLPLGPDVSIAGHHPCGLWALDKPSGVRSHPNENRPDPKALLTVGYDARAECYTDATDGRRWHLLNRLDAPTSGIVLLAEDEAIASIVRNLFVERAVRKTYFALVFGKPRPREDLWEDRLQVKKGPGGARTVRGGHQPAITSMKLIRTKTGPQVQSLLELQPKTGRTHQLRVQCAERQLPIVGDATYGDFRLNREFVSQHGTRRLFLHSGKVAFQFQWNGQKIGFKASARLPDDFETVLA